MPASAGKPQLTKHGSPQKGFSLGELLVASALFAFGLASVLPLIVLSIRQGEVSGYQTAAASKAQLTLEQISAQAFAPAGGYSDPSGNWIQTSCSPGIQSCGNPVTSAGLIDFTAAPSTGFSLSWADPRQVNYDVRWRVETTASNVKQITLGVRARGAIVQAPPVYLRTLLAP